VYYGMGVNGLNKMSKWNEKSLKELGMMDERDPLSYCLGYGVMDGI
jgi:hypothetical protein